MTVQELREALEDVPDDKVVAMRNEFGVEEDPDFVSVEKEAVFLVVTTALFGI